jgi:hypothetical protein
MWQWGKTNTASFPEATRIFLMSFVFPIDCENDCGNQCGNDIPLRVLDGYNYITAL